MTHTNQGKEAVVRQAINHALERHAAHASKHVEIAVTDDTVVLTGEVPSWAEREAVVRAWNHRQCASRGRAVGGGSGERGTRVASHEGMKTEPTNEGNDVDTTREDSEGVRCFECGAPIEVGPTRGLAVAEGIVLCEACCERTTREDAREAPVEMPPWFEDLTGPKHHT